MKHPDFKWWVGLGAFICVAIIGQAELIGEPWRHWITIVSIILTAANAYMIKGE